MTSDPTQTKGHCSSCGRHLDVPRTERRGRVERGFCVNSRCRMAWTLQPLGRAGSDHGPAVRAAAAPFLGGDAA